MRRFCCNNPRWRSPIHLGVQTVETPMHRPCFEGCRAILFDFGGTLDSDGEHWLDRFFDLYEAGGLDVSRDEIKRVFYEADETCCADAQVHRMGLRPLMRYHVRLQFAGLGIQNAAKERKLAAQFCAKTEIVLRRNAELLRRLSRTRRLGVVSNFYGNVETLCREAGLAESLDVILDSARVGIRKPDPEIFRMALEKLRMTAEETIFVGDSYERDVVPARLLGMKTVWVKGPNPRLPRDAEPADFIISDLPQLERVLR
jgi:putative hydrolase of the HAD superfamily